MTEHTTFPIPQPGASLMLAFQGHQKNMLIIGDNSIAANRAFSCLEADARVFLIANPDRMCPELKYRVESHQVILLGSEFNSNVLTSHTFDLAFICCSTGNLFGQLDIDSVVKHFRQHRVPVNVSDQTRLCDFFMTSTYRDQSLQVSVSTNGQASKLSNRIRRHIASTLPPHLGDAVRKMGLLRKKIRASDPSSAASIRRMKWLAQICEYWSMERLAQLSDKDMNDLLEAYHHDEGYESSVTSNDAREGSITLVGAGTGDPGLLTVAAHQAIKEADLVLSDKIVPEEVVALVECELKIARKFPGNADAAQEEFNELALKAIQQGKKVVRLKQGDPYLFGRGGEEVLFFRKHNIIPRVIPGISSSVAAPLLAGIPLTHRSVASQFLVTTGTGAQKSPAPLPTYEKHRTDVFLMAIHRLEAITHDLISKQNYPADIPCAIIERASCKDQRVIYGPLSRIASILERCGGSRPPGLLVVGHAIDVLKHENKGTEGVVANIVTYSGNMKDKQGEQVISGSNLLQLHDPESIY
ncbi:hypothetical protein BCV72DRAFT_208217 [Rhizopus microsporus var. microsporus]|nr:hypothetical protein BCV72DRAFT_208217 [Rhizopus microsporus var. microsporus]